MFSACACKRVCVYFHTSARERDCIAVGVVRTECTDNPHYLISVLEDTKNKKKSNLIIPHKLKEDCPTKAISIS